MIQRNQHHRTPRLPNAKHSFSGFALERTSNETERMFAARRTESSGVCEDDMDHNLQLLGIAKKAGLVAIGGDATSIAARAGKAKLVLSAADASESAVRRARTNAETGGAVHISVPYTQAELGMITGRGSPGTVAILDAGLAAGFVKGLAETEPDRYRGPAEKLKEQAETLTVRKKHTSSRKRRIAT